MIWANVFSWELFFYPLWFWIKLSVKKLMSWVGKSFHSKLSLDKWKFGLYKGTAQYSTNNFLCVFSMCIFREFTTNSQQTEILSIHNDWRRKEHLLGNFKSFHKQMSSNLSRKRAQMATWRMSFKRHSKAFKVPASCLRSKGCQRLCSENISPPPCADPGGFQVMKAQIQRGVIFAIIFSKNLPVCKPQGLHPP